MKMTNSPPPRGHSLARHILAVAAVTAAAAALPGCSHVGTEGLSGVNQLQAAFGLVDQLHTASRSPNHLRAYYPEY